MQAGNSGRLSLLTRLSKLNLLEFLNDIRAEDVGMRIQEVQPQLQRRRTILKRAAARRTARGCALGIACRRGFRKQMTDFKKSWRVG